MYDFTQQQVLPSASIQGLQAILLLPQRERQIRLVLKLVENPPAEILIRARLDLFNRQTFDFIQEMQRQPRTMTNDEILAKVTKIDATLNEQLAASYKIKDRETKAEVAQSVFECKEKTSKIMELLRQGL